MILKRSVSVTILCAILCCATTFSQSKPKKHIFLCRSPLLAFDFWKSLHEEQQKGITVTPVIAQQICNGMKAGSDPQCIRVEADDFKTIATGWGGAMAMTDGKTKYWFHSPDAGGWVHPEYYVMFQNSKPN